MKKYCMIILGDNSKRAEMLMLLPSNRIAFLDAKGVSISTFITSINIDDMMTILKDYIGKYNFFIYEVNENSFVSMTDNNILNTLFQISFDLSITDIMGSKEISGVEDISDTDKLSEDSRVELIDFLLDKGIENLTSDELNLLKKIS